MGLVGADEQEVWAALPARPVTKGDIGRLPAGDQAHVQLLVAQGIIQTDADLIDYGAQVARERRAQSAEKVGAVTTRLFEAQSAPKSPKPPIPLLNDVVVAEKAPAQRILAPESETSLDAGTTRHGLRAAIVDGLGHYAQLYITFPR